MANITCQQLQDALTEALSHNEQITAQAQVNNLSLQRMFKVSPTREAEVVPCPAPPHTHTHRVSFHLQTF